MGLHEPFRGDVDHSSVDIHELGHRAPSCPWPSRAEQTYTPGSRLRRSSAARVMVGLSHRVSGKVPETDKWAAASVGVTIIAQRGAQALSRHSPRQRWLCAVLPTTSTQQRWWPRTQRPRHTVPVRPTSSVELPSGQLGRFGLGPCRQRRRGSCDLGGFVDRSLRRLGQLLVVMGALLGAVLGVALALMVGNAETSSAVAGPGRGRAAVLAASPSSTTPSASRAASTQDPGNGSNASDNQRVEAAGRGDQRDGKAGQKGERRKTRPTAAARANPARASNWAEATCFHHRQYSQYRWCRGRRSPPQFA
jgi:hypothetical protein